MNLAVVPAAGRSSRLGRTKALLPFGPSLVLDSVVESLMRGGIDRLVVVAAPGEDRLIEHCARSDLAVAINQRVAEGMLSSVQCGIRSLPGPPADDDTVTICPVDFPALRAATVSHLLSSLYSSPHRIAVPRFLGRRGHPMVFAADLAQEVHGLDPALGLRALLDLHSYLQVDTEDPGVSRDLDTWLDYVELTHTSR